ncbi:MAG TPA: cortex morphogenetic protein CmpA [Bacillales bacterium]|nr:cortex morphogenetic protein CmpA [Bacillales bacterium]
MPYWFKKQLRKAYFRKDRYQIRMLNQCWFFYTERQQH